MKREAFSAELSLELRNIKGSDRVMSSSCRKQEIATVPWPVLFCISDIFPMNSNWLFILKVFKNVMSGAEKQLCGHHGSDSEHEEGLVDTWHSDVDTVTDHSRINLPPKHVLSFPDDRRYGRHYTRNSPQNEAYYVTLLEGSEDSAFSDKNAYLLLPPLKSL